MTTTNSTAAQLKGKRIFEWCKKATIAMNVLSAIGAILFVVISKL